MAERLQKLIAQAGVASRRTAEDLIRAGAVRVNGRVVTQLGTKADPASDRIEVDGKILRFPSRKLYLALNKPRGYVSTAHDPQGRPTVFRLLRHVRERLFAVGRLPYDVEGLLLLTNDGDFSAELLRARLPQTYALKLKGSLSPQETERLARTARQRSPVRLAFKRVKPGPNPWYEVCVTDPRTDWFRSFLFRLGHPVEKIKRVAIGSFREVSLKVGEHRELKPGEVTRLRREAANRGRRQYISVAV